MGHIAARTVGRNKEPRPGPAPGVSSHHRVRLAMGWPRVGSCQSQPSLTDINHCYLSSGEAGPASRAPPNTEEAAPGPDWLLTSSQAAINQYQSPQCLPRDLFTRTLILKRNVIKLCHCKKDFKHLLTCCLLFFVTISLAILHFSESVAHNYFLTQAQPQASTCQICAISKSIIFMTFNFPVLRAGCLSQWPTFSLRCLFLLPAKCGNCVISDKQS